MNIEHVKDKVSMTKRTLSTRKELKVELTDSSYIRIKAHYQSFSRTWSNENLDASFTEDDFKQYIESIFALRIQSISTTLKEYTKFAKRAKIPALVYLVLEQIGRVEAKDYGVTIVPKLGDSFYDIVKDEKTGGERKKIKTLSVSKMEEISLKLQELEDLGHEMGRGVPLDENGEINFMLMQIIDKTLMTSLTETHPVYALLHSFIKLSSLQDIFIPRITYLDCDEYDHQYNELIRRRA